MAMTCPNSSWHDSAPARATQECPECPEGQQLCRYCDGLARFVVTDRPQYAQGACQKHLRRLIEAFLFALGSLHVTVTKVETGE